MSAVAAHDPLLALYRRTGGSAEGRAEAIARYAFAVLDDAAADAIVEWAPDGIVEIGAGTGYWARQLGDRGVDVVAFDPAPPPSAASSWFAGVESWFDVATGDEAAAAAHADRCLLLVWPTKNETWAADAVRLFHEAGGEHIVYVGEPTGGRTGDDVFHAMTGGLDRCYHCELGLPDVVCVRDVPSLFEVHRRVEIPRWVGFDDAVVLLRRVERDRRRRPGTRWWQRSRA